MTKIKHYLLFCKKKFPDVEIFMKTNRLDNYNILWRKRYEKILSDFDRSDTSACLKKSRLDSRCYNIYSKENQKVCVQCVMPTHQRYIFSLIRCCNYHLYRHSKVCLRHSIVFFGQRTLLERRLSSIGFRSDRYFQCIYHKLNRRNKRCLLHIHSPACNC